MVAVDKRKRTPIPKERQAEFDRKLAAGKISGTSEKLERESNIRTGKTVSREEPKEAGTLVRKESEGGNIPASEVTEDKNITKRILEATFPKEDPIRDIVLSVIPVGRAAKGIKAGVQAVKTGVGFSKEIGRINKFVKPTKVSKAAQVGKITKKGNVKIPYQTNAKTVKETNSLLLKVVKQYRNPIVIVGTIGAMLSTYPWSEWALGEAKEGMIFNVNKAINTGDVNLLNEFLETSDEIFDMTIWETMRRLIPGANLQFTFGEKAQALMAQKKVNDKIVQDEIIKIQTGETEDDRWKRIREEEAEADKEAVDYYNEQRKIMVEWEAEARRNQRSDDAAFWRKERAKQRVKEAEDRKAIADFWIEYRKAAAKLREDSRPSNLNFGLL